CGPAHTLVDNSPGSGLAPTAPAPVCELALDFFSDHLLQDLLVERQVGHQPLQPRIFLAHLPQLADFRHPEAAELLLPHVERSLPDARRRADIRHWRPGLGEAQGVGDLLFGVPRLLHRFSFPLRGWSKRPYSISRLSRKTGTTSKTSRAWSVVT